MFVEDGAARNIAQVGPAVVNKGSGCSFRNGLRVPSFVPNYAYSIELFKSNSYELCSENAAYPNFIFIFLFDFSLLIYTHAAWIDSISISYAVKN